MRRLLVLLSALAALIVFVPLAVLAQDSTPEADSAGPARTDVRYFLPFGPAGLNAALTVAGTESGTCNADSLAVPNRPDAWDCLGEGNQIHDPCFENPHAVEGDPVELACVVAPFSSDVVLLAVDGPLQRDKDAPESQDLFPAWDLPWALELANGDRCVLHSSIEVVLAGETVYYDCEAGGSILGEVDRGQPIWTVNYLAEGAVSSGLVDVTAAWS